MDFTVIVIDAKGGGESRFSFSKDEVTIGRVQGNDIILARGNVSKRHSRIVAESDQFLVVDMKSTNGTFVNGHRITAPETLKPGDKIYVGDFVLGIEIGDHPGISNAAGLAFAHSPPPPPHASVAASQSRGPHTGGAIAVDDHDVVSSDDLADLVPPSRIAHSKRSAGSALDDSAVEVIDAVSEKSGKLSAREAESVRRPPAPPIARKPADDTGIAPGEDLLGAPVRPPSSQPPPLAGGALRPPGSPSLGEAPPADQAPDLRAHLNLLELIFGRLATEFDMTSDAFVDAEDAEMRTNVEKSIRNIASQLIDAGAFPETIEPEAVVRDALEQAIGLGPLSNVLHDPDVNEIWLSPSGSVMVARGSKRAVLSERFTTAATADLAVRRLERAAVSAQPNGQASRASADTDAAFVVRLSNGARAVGSLSRDLGGPYLRVWATNRERNNIEEIAKRGILSAAAADLLKAAITAQRTVLVVGAPSSSKNIVAHALALAFPGSAWTLSVGVTVPMEPELNAVALDLGSIPSGERDRVLARWHTAMRSRPERLLVEDLGDEWAPVLAAPLAHALQAGRGGSVVMLDGLSLEGALERWTSLCGGALSSQAGRALVTSAVQIAVLVEPPSPGARFGSIVSRVAEVTLSAISDFDLVDLMSPRTAGAGGGELTSRGKQLAAMFTKGL